MIDQHVKAFLEEAGELLSTLEETLISLENDPENNELLDNAFRAMHTIKGSSAMFGFEDVSMFTHDIENVYDCIRNGELKITKEIIDLTLAAKDQIEIVLFGEGNGKIKDDEAVKNIVEQFSEILKSVTNNEITLERKVSSEQTVSGVDSSPDTVTYLISMNPVDDIYMTGNDPALLIEELVELGKAVVIADTRDIPEFDLLNPEKNYLKWKIVLETSKTIDDIKDIFIFVEDECEVNIEKIGGEGLLTGNEILEKVKSELMSNPDLSLEEIKELFAQPVKKVFTSNEYPKRSVAAQSTFKEKSSSIRVSAEKLDELVNLVGELVIAQAGLNQIAEKRKDNELVSLSEQIEHLTSELRDSTLNIRMLPIGTTFSKFVRLVRDLSNELEKEIELETFGGDTELDKTVLERLNDPLVHIIRNSVDHGLENVEERIKKGKSAKGKIRISATQSSGNVIIEIADDGKGLNIEAIRNKAIQNEIITEDSDLTENELFNLIFHPGFSTAAKVSSVSGRGVGMDVVKTSIEELRGTVSIKSKKDEGTSVILNLPLTLAIIDGLLVQVEDEFFVLPLAAVEECIELTDEIIDQYNGRHIVNIRDEIVPYIRVREHFDVEGKKPEIEQVVIAKIDENRIGFVVDEVIGQHQTVLKKLGKAFENLEGISGATILGDGTVALILDIIKLSQKQELEETEIYCRV